MTTASWSGCVLASSRTLSSTRTTDPGSLGATTRGLLAGRTALAAHPPLPDDKFSFIIARLHPDDKGRGVVAAPEAAAPAVGPSHGKGAQVVGDIPDIIGR